MSKLARGWKKEPLVNVLTSLESGSRPKGGVKNIKRGIPSIGGEHLNNNGKFNFEKIKYIPIEFYNSMNKGKIEEGDVLIVKDGATTGKTSFVNNEFPYNEAAVNEHVFIARANNKIKEKLLFYYLFSHEGQLQLKKNVTGSAQGGINRGILKNICICYLESKKEQNLIVEEIETQFIRLDAAKKSLESVKKKLDVYRNSVLKAAFEGELIRLQGGLVDRTLSEEFEIIMGQSPKSKYYNKFGEGLPFFQGKKEFSKLYPKIETWSTKASKIAGKGDVLLSIRAPIGPVNIAPSKCGIGRGLAAIKSNEKTRSNLIFYLLQILRNELKKRGTGTTFKAITKPNLYSLSIKLPKTKEDRDLLLKKIEFHFSVIDKIEQTVDSALLKSEQLRKLILKSAFEGKLVKYEGGSHD